MTTMPPPSPPPLRPPGRVVADGRPAVPTGFDDDHAPPLLHGGTDLHPGGGELLVLGGLVGEAGELHAVGHAQRHRLRAEGVLPPALADDGEGEVRPAIAEPRE